MLRVLPSARELRDLFHYDINTGGLFHKTRDARWFVAGGQSPSHAAAIWNARFAGKPALNSLSKEGYRYGSLFGKKAKAHRVAYKIMHNSDPVDVDHINGIKSDNRPSNLRSVSRTENNCNASRPKNNTSGVVGVFWFEQTKKWQAQISKDQKKIHLGFFSSFSDAVSARKAAESQLGFHPNHGR